jgi:hypothetical protein
MAMRNAFVWAMMVAAAMTVPALAGGGGMPGNGVRNSGANRTRNVLPAMPVGGGSGQVIQLSESYSILDTTSIFRADRGAKEDGVGPPPPPPPPPAPRVSPVFRAAMVDDVGPLALVEISDGKGGMTVEYLREGQTFFWDGSKVLGITLDSLRLSRPAIAGALPWLDVPIGCNLNGRQIGALPTTPAYLSNDATGAIRNTGGTTGIGRGRVPGAMRGATMNGGLPGGIMSGSLPDGTTPAVIGAAIDPPLPTGSADDLAGRMALRRQNQLSGLTEPVSLPATSTVR